MQANNVNNVFPAGLNRELALRLSQIANQFAVDPNTVFQLLTLMSTDNQKIQQFTKKGDASTAKVQNGNFLHGGAFSHPGDVKVTPAAFVLLQSMLEPAFDRYWSSFKAQGKSPLRAQLTC